MPEFEPEFNPEIPDFDPEAGHELIDTLEQMIRNSTIPEERKEALYCGLFSMGHLDCVALYDELKDKQVDRITSGQNYNQGHIIQHLKRYL